MTTLRKGLAKLAMPLAGIWFIAFGFTYFGLAIPAAIMGLFLIVVGVCFLCAS